MKLGGDVLARLGHCWSRELVDFKWGAMALSQAARLTIALELKQRLPRLIFAAVDAFPLADGGKEGGVAVIAVRSLPPDERLDSSVAASLEELAGGSHRPPVQLKARQIHMQIAEAPSLDLKVNWHDVVDYSRLLQKGLPSAVEALQHQQDSAQVLHSTHEWWELKAALSKASAPEHAVAASKPYKKACIGAAISLLHQRDKTHAGKGAGFQEATMTSTTMQIVHLLARRVAHEKEALQLDALAKGEELSTSTWKPLLQRLCSAAEAAAPLPKLDCLDEWCQQLRETDYEMFKQGLRDVEGQDALLAWRERWGADGYGGLSGESAASTSSTLAKESSDAMRHVESLIPAGSELTFLAQTGSFMYDLQVETSDMDFSLIYQALPDSLLSLKPPREEFSQHVHQGFASNKKGAVEYCGRELGSFITLLAKGNPKNVELLFTRKPNHHSWAWEELLEARECFLTLRCAKQYMGFISERLFRARDLLKGSEGESDEFERGSEFSKLLYHAHHKMLDLGRILRGGCPMVALSGKERQEVLELRLRRPSRTDAQALLEKAEAQRAHLASELKVVEASKARPAEVDANALNKWLRSVRVRMALGVNRGAMPRPLGSLPRTRSCEEQQAIKDLIDEIAFSQKIKVVIAGYGISSRTMGTSHSKSDHDIKCIFVHPRSMYFGLQSLTTTFKQHFPGAAGGCDVEISGWEARHALQMLAEDNPAVIGVLSTPSAFVGEEWRERLLQIATKWTDRGRLMVHWYNHTRRNFQSYIKSNDSPLRKRYVHVLRPLLSVAWQRREKGSNFPPLDLAELLQQVTDLGAVAAAEAAAVSSLIHQVEELPEALPRSSQLDELIVRLLQDEKMPSSKPSSGLGDVWHQLCVEMVSTAAPVE